MQENSDTKKPHYTVINGVLRFDGDCANTRAFCGAVCCRSMVVMLTKEEQESGKYDFVEPTKGCTCPGCQSMRQTGKRAVRRNESGCLYLDGANQCSIYDDRPAACRDYDCRKVFWNLYVKTGKSLVKDESTRTQNYEHISKNS